MNNNKKNSNAGCGEINVDLPHSRLLFLLKKCGPMTSSYSGLWFRAEMDATRSCNTMWELPRWANLIPVLWNDSWKFSPSSALSTHSAIWVNSICHGKYHKMKPMSTIFRWALRNLILKNIFNINYVQINVKQELHNDVHLFLLVSAELYKFYFP